MQLSQNQHLALAITAAVFTGIFLLLCCCRSSNRSRVHDHSSGPKHDKVLNLLN